MTKLTSVIGYSRQKARKIMERHLNVSEPLPSNCHIHHRDRNPLNNDISNLSIKGAGEHVRLHWRNDPHPKTETLKRELKNLESLLICYNADIA